MSEIQETIEALKSGHYNADTFRYEFTNKSIILALMVAEEALEKQDFAKVVYPDTNYSGLPVAQCPRCGNRGISYGNCFCSKCGQRLDWSDEE